MQVLIVEDHKESREGLKQCLVRQNYNVATAADLRTGLEFLGRQRFDAIISDIELPDGTGYALISELRRRGIRGLFIAISGLPYPADVNEPGVTGFHYHLTKPVDCEHLYSLLEKGSPKVERGPTGVASSFH